MLSVSVMAALLADRILGELPRWHPLVGFGHLANKMEARCRLWAKPTSSITESLRETSESRLQRAGTFGWIFLVLLPASLLALLQSALSDGAVAIVGVVVLYFSIGARSLAEHARAVAKPLFAGDLDAARQQLSLIVSRDTQQLDNTSVTKATIESVLENGSDAVLAPIFWFVIAGAPGVVVYRLSNTLDAMWGYRNECFLHYGRTAARMDDVLNWIPARLCAISYAMVGNYRTAMRCWREQAAQCDSPNAGPVMAAGAGALGVTVGGAATYSNQLHKRPTLGEGVEAVPADIERALALLMRATGIWVLVIFVWEIL